MRESESVLMGNIPLQRHEGISHVTITVAVMVTIITTTTIIIIIIIIIILLLLLLNFQTARLSSARPITKLARIHNTQTQHNYVKRKQKSNSREL